ncbi:MAG TPA: protein kinase [Vicinamibacteria bacterium]|nr:protein kinase [Vicinamibacteria bacterium]
MGLLLGLLESPLALGAGGLLVAFLLYRFLADRIRVRLPAVDLSLDGVAGKVLGKSWTERKLKRELARLRKGANFLAAGKLLEDAGQPVAAAETYLEGQEFWAAAATYEKLGRNEKAAELFLQAGDYKKGAALFTTAGKPARAAALFLEKGNNLEAARLFGQAGQWQTAAELYEKSGYPLRAAEAWDKDGKLLKSAECYEKHFTENVTLSTTYSATAASTENKTALLAGDRYLKAGELARAAAIYERGGFFRQAAEAQLKAKQPARAAELFLRAEDEARAADALEQAGDAPRAAMLRGEAAFKADRPAEAAAWFVKGRDFLRAAELYESLDMLKAAAEAYEAGESWAAAGSVYVRAGLEPRAAAAFEKAGDLATAAALFEKLGDARRAGSLYDRAGDAFKGGQAAAQGGDRERAITLLQRVGPGDENHLAATELLAQLLVETGRPALAVERLRKSVGSAAIGPANLGLYYWLAVAQEASGARAEALSLYKQVQAEDLGFRDVAQRMARLASGAPPLPPPAGQAGPDASLSAFAVGAPPPAAAAVPPPAVPAPTAPTPAAGVPRGPRFLAKDEIGRGPLGVVYRGEDAADGRNVAMRVMPTALFAAEGVLQAVAADLKSAAALSHPNLAKVIAFTRWQGERCVVSEYVPGRTFAEAIASGRRMRFQQVHALGRMVAQVLQAMHARGIVHGSIQPSNVMVAAGVIKVTDAGLGRVAQHRGGASSYRAPEGGLTVADDLYGLCAVMYHLLTGTHPRSQAQGVGLPLPSQLAAGVPEAMDKLLVRGLHPRPELRFASAEDLARELREMVRIG